MTDQISVLEPFDSLLGSWATEATHPAFDVVVAGAATFELLEGAQFLLVRSSNEHESFPDFLGVIGAPESGEGLVMEYFDSRGVRRTYRVSLDGGVLRFWRDGSPFDQRFSATLGRNSFQGQWQLAQTSGDWQDDLKVIYRRSEQSAGSASRKPMPVPVAVGLVARVAASPWWASRPHSVRRMSRV
jgi:hypothetical protein